MDNSWNFQSMLDGTRYEGVPLHLEWDVEDAWAFSDNNLPEEISAGKLLARWAEGHSSDVAVRLRWIVTCEERALAENAPFCGQFEHFLAHFTHPSRDPGFGLAPETLLNFATLPVKDQTWRPGVVRGRAGFIQEATGWKPSPLQASMDLHRVLNAWVRSGAE